MGMPPEKMLPFANTVVCKIKLLSFQAICSTLYTFIASFVTDSGFYNIQGAAGCRAVGARPGMPYRNDPRLAPYLCSGVLN